MILVCYLGNNSRSIDKYYLQVVGHTTKGKPKRIFCVPAQEREKGIIMMNANMTTAIATTAPTFTLFVEYKNGENSNLMV